MHGIISITIQPQKITITIIHRRVIEEKNPSTEHKTSLRATIIHRRVIEEKNPSTEHKTSLRAHH